MKSVFLFIAGLSLFFTSEARCQQTKDLLNLSYGKHRQQTLDLFLPASYSMETPVVIMLHGGGWVMGGKEYTDKRAKDLRARGFIVANVDYRYVSESVHCDELLSDIDNAIKYVGTKSKELKFSNSNYHMAGISAGAHLALLYGYTTDRKIHSISAFCAPSKLDDSSIHLHLKNTGLVQNVEFLANAKFTPGGKISPEFKNVSPYSHVKQVPTLLIHGTKDDLVPYSQSALLYQLLQKKKIESKLLTMEGKGHDAGLNYTETEKEAYDAVTSWIKQNNK